MSHIYAYYIPCSWPSETKNSRGSGIFPRRWVGPEKKKTFTGRYLEELVVTSVPMLLCAKSNSNSSPHETRRQMHCDRLGAICGKLLGPEAAGVYPHARGLSPRPLDLIHFCGILATVGIGDITGD